MGPGNKRPFPEEGTSQKMVAKSRTKEKVHSQVANQVLGRRREQTIPELKRLVRRSMSDSPPKGEWLPSATKTMRRHGWGEEQMDVMGRGAGSC